MFYIGLKPFSKDWIPVFTGMTLGKDKIATAINRLAMTTVSIRCRVSYYYIFWNRNTDLQEKLLGGGEVAHGVGFEAVDIKAFQVNAI